MLGVFGEYFQHAFIVAAFVHQIIQYHDSLPLRKPLHQGLVIGNPFVKNHTVILHGLKSVLPNSITITHLGRRVSNNSGFSNKSFSVNTVLPHPEGPTTEKLEGV